MSTLVSSKHKCTVNFLNELHQRYSCGICYHVADEPLSCGSKDGCTGVFCVNCLKCALTIRKECPICRFLISGTPQKNNIIKETIADEQSIALSHNYRQMKIRLREQKPNYCLDMVVNGLVPLKILTSTLLTIASSPLCLVLT